MSFKVGSLVGAYRIVKPLGKGGMGEVYEVEHERLGVRLALKAFVLAGKDRAFLRKRFVAEGRVLARISDPRIVHVVDLDVEPGTDTPYFVMNLVTGPNGAPRTLARSRRQLLSRRSFLHSRIGKVNLGMDGHNGRAGCPHPAETPGQREERLCAVTGRWGHRPLPA